MGPSPSRKRARIQLRSKVRRDSSSTLHELFTKARRHEDKLKDNLAKSDNIIADLRDSLGHEREYVTRVKKERDELRDKCSALNDRIEKLLSRTSSYKEEKDQEIANLKEEIADLKRIKNRERTTRDAKIVEDTTASVQRGVEKAMKKLYFDFDKIFAASRHTFDPEWSSSEDEQQKDTEMPCASEEGAPAEPPAPQSGDIPSGDGGQRLDDANSSDSEKTEQR